MNASRVARYLAGGAKRAPGMAIRGGAVAGIGAMAIGAGLMGEVGVIGGAALFEARHASRQWKDAVEAEHMSRILATAQEGPFGTGNRPYGMGPNFSNSAGMSLAMHYARNGTGIKDPFFSLAGLGGRSAGILGGALGA